MLACRSPARPASKVRPPKHRTHNLATGGTRSTTTRTTTSTRCRRRVLTGPTQLEEFVPTHSSRRRTLHRLEGRPLHRLLRTLRDTLHLDAVLVSLREDALRELRAGYPSAQAAEQLLLRLAAADAACVMHLQTAELALANKVHESLVHDAGNVLALARALKDIVTVNTAIRGRVQSSLTAASTLMAQRRLTQLHQSGSTNEH